LGHTHTVESQVKSDGANLHCRGLAQALAIPTLCPFDHQRSLGLFFGFKKIQKSVESKFMLEIQVLCLYMNIIAMYLEGITKSQLLRFILMMADIREEKLLQSFLWKMVHFALFLVKISINFRPGYSTLFFFPITVRLYFTKISKL
jgi:hypothetical protein